MCRRNATGAFSSAPSPVSARFDFVFRAAEGAPLLVYAGRKETLLLGWAIEALYLDAVTTIALAIGAAAAGLVGYLISL